MLVLIELIIWKFIDLQREIKRIIRKEERKLHFFGIYGFFGLPGKGKTMALSWQLDEYRRKYKDKIYICTNYHYNKQDFEFTTWKQLLKTYDKPLIVAWDEVQNEFNSRDFKNFPVELLTILTQNRKGNGIQLLYTAQRWGRVDKVFRELTHYCIQCSTMFKRLTSLKYYYWEDYEQLQSTPAVQLKMKIHPTKKVRFIQSDKLRESYDSYKMLESAKTKEYQERPIINLENFYN